MFSELHTRSAFSFLSSGSQPQRLVTRAAELGILAVALLDRDTVAGAVRFHFEAKEHGIQPIIGAEITMDDGSLLPLVPLNLTGYQNLSKLITTIKLRHKKGEHFATRDDIEEHSAGLLCFTGGADGFIHNSIKQGRGLTDLAWLNYVFEKRLYVELQRHHLRHEEHINQTLLGYAHKLKLPIFASNGAYYADEHDRELFDVFTCIKNHTTIYEAGKLLSENSERYLKNEQQMLRLFADMPETVEVTNEIVSRIDFSMDELSYNFPDYPVPAGETADAVLREKAIARSFERYRDKTWHLRSQVRARLEKEFRVIEMKKLAGYFLTVCDISDFCKESNILSQGRGSAANSVVCYALGITAVEPIGNKLLFERFLSEKYEQYPDIDIDLPSGDDRESVIQHVYTKYGRRSSAMTANVICYRGKSAVREVGKTFGFGDDVLKRLSKLNSHYETFKGKELDHRLKEAGFDPTADQALRKFAEIYQRILDFPRHLGQHSGGMVVSLGRLDGIVPIEPASMENRSIIQWDKDDCEALKIVKIDLLGLGMMAVLRDTITLIKEHHGEDLSLYRLPYNDPAVFDALQKGDTVGMFQVESRAQIAFLPKSKPANFYDIVVQVAIIRPGPIVGHMLHSYIKRRQGLEPVTYPHESLKPVLERTMGVPLFQEQLLKMAMDIAGFTGSEAEELRRAMGFKRPDIKLEKIGRNLRAGMTKNGISKEVQEQIVDYVKAFSNYGFPESHAYSFALLAYASAYFIIHYRACFMAAMLNNYPLGFYSAATLVKDAQRHGLHFRPLDINRSDYIFKYEEGDVRVGLKFVRGLRKEIGEAIVAERQAPSRIRRSICGEACFAGDVTNSLVATPPLSANSSGIAARLIDQPPEKHSFSANGAAGPQCRCGWYTSIADLIERVPEINKKEIRALSIAGALNLDNTVHRREALWQSELEIQPSGELFESGRVSSPTVREGADQIAGAQVQPTCCDEGHKQRPAIRSGALPYGRATDTPFLHRMEGIDLVDADLRKTGISIGKHPMAFVRDEMTRRGVITAIQSLNLKKNQVVSVAGAVIIRQRPMTANNVVFITLEDETGFANFVVMPDKFEQYRSVINTNDFLMIRGIFEERGMLKALHFTPVNEVATEVVSHDFR
ncbi:MAG: error-prone DNA polymerase [Chloracidobacterium sp.]|nr:error-prone DNA polymerase [Chloracidobacterium sp.]